jgi:hypothetical protein
MAIEVNGEPVSMKDFYPDINPPKGSKTVVFKRCNFELHKRIVSSLDRGPNLEPIPQWQASTQSVDSGGIMIPLSFYAAIDLDPQAHNATQQHVRFFKTKTIQGQGPTAITVYTGDDLFIRGAGATIDVTTPEGLQIYRVMMVSPFNKTNAKRYGQRNPLFELEEPEKFRAEQNKKTINRNKAIGLAFNKDEVPDSLAIQIHREISNSFLTTSNTDVLVEAENWETLRNDLSLYASAHPDKFEALVNDANVGTRGLIKEALEKGVLTKDKSRWYWGTTKGVKNKKDFCIIAVGQDPVQELLNHFLTKLGRKDLTFLETEMEQLVS